MPLPAPCKFAGWFTFILNGIKFGGGVVFNVNNPVFNDFYVNVGCDNNNHNCKVIKRFIKIFIKDSNISKNVRGCRCSLTALQR